MSDKANCTSWAEGVPAPVDRDGNSVPLMTRRLYDKTGREVEVSEIALAYSMISGCLVWRVRAYSGVVLSLDCLCLDPPDSWERLLKDLDRAADASGNSRCACSYLTGDASTECDDCRFNEDARWCVRIMAADVARRIRALREADNAD